MTSLIESISLFPETRIWKIKKQPEVRHIFGGIVSILLFIAVGVIFTVKLIEVFDRKTLTVREDRRIGTEELRTTINTYQKESESKPVMMAVNNMSGAYEITAAYVNKT